MENKNQKGINLVIEEFKQEILQTISNSRLPIAVIQLVMQSIMTEVDKAYYATVSNEVQKASQTEEETETGEEDKEETTEE